MKSMGRGCIKKSDLCNLWVICLIYGGGRTNILWVEERSTNIFKEQ